MSKNSSLAVRERLFANIDLPESKKKARREAKAKKSKEQKQSSKSTKSKASPSSAPAETSIRDSDTSPTRPSPPKKSPSSANKERKVPPNFRELKQGLEYSEDGKDLVAASLTTYLNCLISGRLQYNIGL